MYTGPLKRIRKRDLTPAGVTFQWVEREHLKDVEITLEGGKTGKETVDTLDIQGMSGDELCIHLWVKLRNKRGTVVSKRLCTLIPSDRLPVYILDESGPRMKPSPVKFDTYDDYDGEEDD
ncbi:MAG: hypothetical protein WC683_20695 [bacterium]